MTRPEPVRDDKTLPESSWSRVAPRRPAEWLVIAALAGPAALEKLLARLQ
jgi:hypothetical protein